MTLLYYILIYKFTNFPLWLAKFLPIGTAIKFSGYFRLITYHQYNINFLTPNSKFTVPLQSHLSCLWNGRQGLSGSWSCWQYLIA